MDWREPVQLPRSLGDSLRHVLRFDSSEGMVSLSAMKLSLLLLALLTLSCRIAPVITDPSYGGRGSDRYSDCRRASQDYCREVLGTSEDEMKKCVANFTYDCLTGGSQ